MDLLTRLIVWLMILAAAGWLLSFWPRYLAARTGTPELEFLKRPWMLGLGPYQRFWPFISFGFYSYLWKQGRILEFMLAILAVIMVSRAGSAFLQTIGAVGRSGL